MISVDVLEWGVLGVAAQILELGLRQRTLDVDHALLGCLDCPGDGVPLRVLVNDGWGERDVGQTVAGRFRDLWLLRILNLLLL